jgi:hypothetical protein
MHESHEIKANLQLLLASLIEISTSYDYIFSRSFQQTALIISPVGYLSTNSKAFKSHQIVEIRYNIPLLQSKHQL